MKSYNIFILLVGLILSACVKEDPRLDLNILPEKTTVQSGEPLNFTVEGEAEFLVFYSGLEGERFEDYPNATSSNVNTLSDPISFSYTYNFHGPVKAIFVATSYGNWGEDSKEQTFEFDFEIVDNNTEISVATLKTPGLFGEEFEGLVNANTNTVVVNIPQGSDLSRLTTNLVTASTRSTILLDGQAFDNKSQVDFSNLERSFTINAIGGATQDWTIQVVLE